MSKGKLNDDPIRKSELRALAEERLRKSTVDIASMPVRDVENLVYELRVHQVELEIQNEELRRARVGAAQSGDRDALERRIKERTAELQAANDQLRRAQFTVDHSQEAIFWISGNGSILFANHAAAQLTGYESEELLSMTVIDIDADIADSEWPAMWGRFTKGDIGLAERRLRTKEGRVVPVELSPTHLQFDHTDFVCVFVRDISKRRHAEDELLGIGRILEDSLNEIYVFELDSLKFVAVNRGARQNLGYSMEELRDLTPVDLKPEFTRETFLEQVQPLSASGSDALVFETEHLRKDGSTYEVEVHLQRSDFRGRSCFVAIILDVSHRNATERQLQISDKAIASAAAGIVISDTAGIITYANPAFVRMWGYDSVDEIVGRPNTEFSSSEEDVGEVMEGLRVNGRWVGERVAVKKDGSSFSVEVAASAVYDSDGQTLCLMASFIDISERKRAEMSLRGSEALNQAILGSLSAHIAVIDATGAIIAVNPSWEQFALENDSNLEAVGVGKNYLDVCRDASGHYAEEAPRVLAGLTGILSGSLEDFELEYPCHSETTQRWFHLSATRLSHDSGGAVVSHLNITNRKKVEVNLLDRERRLRAVLNTASDAIVSIDQRGTVVSINPATSKMFGYAEQELIGENVTMLMPSPHSEEHDGFIGRYLETGEARIIGRGREVLGRRKDGSTFAIDLAVSEVEGLGLFTGIIRDISGRKEAEEALRSLYELNENLIQTAQNIVLVLTAQGRVMRFNPAFERLTGWSLAEAEGCDWFEMFLPSRDRERIRRLFAKAIVGNRTSGNVNPIVTKSGEEREIEWYDACLYDAEGNLTGLLCTGTDVTARLQLETEVVNATEEERERIAQDLHDDLGSLLTGIDLRVKSLTNVLSKSGREKDTNNCRAINELVQSAIRKTRMIAKGLHPVGAHPEDLMSALQELCERTRLSSPLRCQFRCREPVLIDVPTVANNLFRIAQEAVHNAVKHCTGSQITVSLKRSNGNVVLKVSDNGGGFDKNAVKTNGLGLHIMKFRASAIGGTLRIRRRKEGGTRVICSMPMPEPAEDTRPEIESG